MRREVLLLDEILEASRRAIDIASHHAVDSLRKNLDARDALLWNLTVVGEAVGHLPDVIREEHPEVPWSHPVRLRNRLVHGYWSLDLDVLHSVATGDLPGFVLQIQEVLQKFESREHGQDDVNS